VKYLAHILITAILVTLSFGSFAQELEARSDINEDLPSSAIDINTKKEFDHTRTPNFPKTKTYIIIRKPEKVLYGNPCMEEITREMGFQYLLIPKTSAEGYTDEDPFWHNLKTHFKLMMKNGIFYKRKIRRAIKFCRQMSGDFVA
jgi:hypothetical protein